MSSVLFLCASALASAFAFSFKGMPAAPARLLLCASALAVASAYRPYDSLKRADIAAPLRPLPRKGAFGPITSPPSVHGASTDSYCVPGQACWPSAAQWAALNTTVGGRLISVQPPLLSCFPGPAYDPTQCASRVANFSNSYWRASQPGAMQSPNLEQDPVTGDCCFDPSKPCDLGDIPPFAVAASTPADVSAALLFATAHKIQVSVKASGHEYQGRSTAPNALLVWVHTMRGIVTEPTFRPCPGDAPRPALTAQSGDSWGGVYAAADQAGATVVGGSEISVSAAGGYTLGGGHSWTSPTYGMAVDNVLRFTAVLANGSAVVAAKCENPDLFWALRGGGGSSFAVVTSATYALHPIPVTGVMGATLVLSLKNGTSSFAAILDATMYCIGNVWGSANNALGSGVVGGGYVLANLAESTVEFLFVFNGTDAQATIAVQPLMDFIASRPDFSVVSSDLTPFPSMHAWHQSWDPTSEATGSVSTIGSRLIPTSLLVDDARRAQMAINLTVIASYIGVVEFLVTCGGVVQQLDRDSAETSISPAWRDAGVHVVIGSGWALNATIATQNGVLEGVSSLTDILRGGVPSSGAYWSESDRLEDDWSMAFWGAANYARLQGIKKAVDPEGVFMCHHCVELPAAA